MIPSGSRSQSAVEQILSLLESTDMAIFDIAIQQVCTRRSV